MAIRDMQQRWRSGAPACITVHLNAQDCATLDAIAMALYRAFPHDPKREQYSPGVYPSRPAAIRFLCAEFRAQHGDPTPLLRRLRTKLANFWRIETSWRRCMNKLTRHRRPDPPWSAQLLSDAAGSILLDRAPAAELDR
jgi:hypothetical protein